MNNIQSLIERVQKTEHGFIDIQAASEEIFVSNSVAETLRLAKELFEFEVHQARYWQYFYLENSPQNQRKVLRFCASV